LKYTIEEIIIASADRGIYLQGDKGQMPSGHNGPWFDEQTPVRNTSHWVITFLMAHFFTKDKKYLRAAQKSLKYLESDEVRPMQATFIIRKNPQKDFNNGLIGQAWVIKSLLLSGIYLNEDRYIDLAKKVFDLHDFNETYSLWLTRNVDGSQGYICATVNQQLWFGAVAGLLYKTTKDKDLKKKLDLFWQKINTNMELNYKGRIIHTIHNKTSILGLKEKIARYRNLRNYEELEIGYHSFNLYAFSFFHSVYPEHEYWYNRTTKKYLKKMVQYTNTQEYRNLIKDNKFAASYNPVGYEIASFLSEFRDYLDCKECDKLKDKWIEYQIENHYNFNTNLMEKNTIDNQTLSARLYQLSQLFLSNVFKVN
jgi:hypothetical protein